MGYYSEVTVTLTGNEQECIDLLNAYKLTETPEQIEMAWHLLHDNPDNDQVKFFYEVIGGTEDIVQLTWLFNGVKWYDESENALARLGELIEDMQQEDKNQSLAITFQRLGENPEDFDEKVWGDSPYDYENPVDVIRHFDIQAPVIEVNPIKQLFKNNEGK